MTSTATTATTAPTACDVAETPPGAGPGSAPGDLVRRTETGYAISTTHTALEGFVVRRRPGRLRADPLAPAPRATPDAPAKDVAWSPGPGGDHAIPGPASAATLLLAGLPAPAVTRMVAPAGAALAAAARQKAPYRPPPAGLRRLRRWLDARPTPGHEPCTDSLRLRGLVERAGVAPRLKEWTAEILDAAASYSLGAPGLLTLYPDPDGSRTVVLVTDEVSAAPAVWDLGWLTGELLELRNDPDHEPRPQPVEEDPIVQAILERYGALAPLPAPDALARAALLRWVIHLHDFASYVAWDDQLPRRLERIAELMELTRDA